MKNKNMENKKESALKKKIRELKQTSRGKAILRLIKWCIFFFILFIFLAIASLITPKTKPDVKPNINNEVNEPTDKTEDDNWNEETLTIETIEKYQKNLSNIYDYKYEINIDKEKYIFTGTKTPKDNKGYKESSSGIIKYLVDNTGTYEETTTEKNIINNLYEGIEESYLDPIYILNILKTLEIKRDRECDCIDPVYKANDAKNIYRLRIINKEMTSISITALDFSYVYNLSFDNIK